MRYSCGVMMELMCHRFLLVLHLLDMSLIKFTKIFTQTVHDIWYSQRKTRLLIVLGQLLLRHITNLQPVFLCPNHPSTSGQPSVSMNDTRGLRRLQWLPVLTKTPATSQRKQRTIRRADRRLATRLNSRHSLPPRPVKSPRSYCRHSA